MRAAPTITPARLDYGPATAAVRAIVSTWNAIDWFVPPTRRVADGARCMLRHHRLARAALPSHFGESLDVEHSQGGWDAFLALCQRAREDSWDWKYGALKPLSHAHATARGWSLDVELALRPQGAPPTGRALFFSLQGVPLWAPIGPALDLRATLSAPVAECAGWYLSYASMDAQHAAVWQLAEPTASPADNPFTPLIQCHAAGFYPFGLARDRAHLFSFA